VSDEKKQVEKTYHALLSVDVREMSELHTVIMDDGNDELKEALKTLLSHHEDVVESDYQLDQMLLNAMEQVDSFANDLGLQAHQHQQRIEEWSEQRNALEEKVAKAEDRCQSLEEKKEKFSSMFADIDASGRLVHQLQRRRTISKYIVELAEGTLVSVRSRLSRDLTMAFKECMPQVTSGRYASVRFGEGFHIEVFNEDRGDFVPLHQLSSGTNDLFVLIFQLVLLRGFMESRQLSSHFIFLDEPLLAVDGDRYAKLTSLLPKISSGLDQIFLCRPPEDQENAYILNTALDQTELVADLTQG
jgi:DNA repair exonuclease SbcCD ATPase subunit